MEVHFHRDTGIKIVQPSLHIVALLEDFLYGEVLFRSLVQETVAGSEYRRSEEQDGNQVFQFCFHRFQSLKGDLDAGIDRTLLGIIGDIAAVCFRVGDLQVVEQEQVHTVDE